MHVLRRKSVRWKNVAGAVFWDWRMIFIDNFGRKPVLVFTLVLGGIACIPAGYAAEGGALQTALSLIGK